MISLKQASILDILPTALTDSNEAKALAYAVTMAMNKAITTMEESMVYANIDMLPDRILNVLALELNVPYWNENASLDEKRRLVKNSYSWLAKGGTGYAIKNLIDSFFDDVNIEEWFDYQGSPYHFRVNIGIVGTVTSDQQALAATLVNAYKNVRSVVDSINFYESGSEIVSYTYTDFLGECIVDDGIAYNY